MSRLSTLVLLAVYSHKIMISRLGLAIAMLEGIAHGEGQSAYPVRSREGR